MITFTPPLPDDLYMLWKQCTADAERMFLIEQWRDMEFPYAIDWDKIIASSMI